ncbi:MAG: hypothetical protein KKB22_04095, partial [Candidatus Omnitrophica bacterium]|nr:hypothetical protein [Candidatus Omnitrophota bacterium]
MSKRVSLINLFIAIIFLFSTIFPPGAFSYSTDSQERALIDESKGSDIVSFKKIRCPNCGMEFFYIPGKDSPHSHWVQYEVKEELSANKEDGLNIEDSLKNNQDKIKELKNQNKLFSLFKLKDTAKDTNATEETAVKKALATQELRGQVEYKLR